MKRDEHGNEDLMREAISLIERIEFRSPSCPDPITLGLNKHEWLFVYFGSDPMYRFDQLGRLRRAFVDGFLYRSAGKTLARLERRGPDGDSQSTESILLRQDLSVGELEEFRIRTRLRIDELLKHLCAAAVTRQYPENLTDGVDRFRAALGNVINSRDFLAPAIVRR